MMPVSRAFRPTLIAFALCSAEAIGLPAVAQTAPAKHAAKVPSNAARKAVPVAEAPIPDAGPEQVKAAEMVYTGKYDCEFNQSLDIEQSRKHSAYVDVKAGKMGGWLMKPVLSSTGAIRLEDVKGETLMVQIAAKSMLLNVKTGHRLVDDCVSAKQHELMEAAKTAKASS